MLHSLGCSWTIEMSTCLECLGVSRQRGNGMLPQIHRSSLISYHFVGNLLRFAALFILQTATSTWKASTKARYLVCHPISINDLKSIHHQCGSGNPLRRDLLSGRGIVGWSSWKTNLTRFIYFTDINIHEISATHGIVHLSKLPSKKMPWKELDSKSSNPVWKSNRF